MKAAYTIITVDDSRADLKRALRERMRGYLPEISDIDFVDARKIDVDAELQRRGLAVNGKFHIGEIGVWLSQINAWEYIANQDEYDAVIVFEDDAVVCPEFELIFQFVWAELPKSFDFMALAVPADQLVDYYYDRTFTEHGRWELNSNMRKHLHYSDHYIGSRFVAKAYQGYSCVATMYSKAGAQKLLDLVKEHGLNAPVDCFIFNMHHTGPLNGYAMMPTVKNVVTFEEKGTIARATGMYN